MSHHHAKKCPFCPSPSPIPSWLRGARSGPPPRPAVRAPPPRRAHAHGHRRFVGHLEGQTLPDRLLPQREALHHRLSDGSRFAQGKLVTGGVTWECPIGEGNSTNFWQFFEILKGKFAIAFDGFWGKNLTGKWEDQKVIQYKYASVGTWVGDRTCLFGFHVSFKVGGPCLSVRGWPLGVGKAPNLQKCLVGLVGSLGAPDSSFGSWNSELHKKKITYRYIWYSFKESPFVN